MSILYFLIFSSFIVGVIAGHFMTLYLKESEEEKKYGLKK